MIYFPEAENIGRQEGFKNINDIYDLPTDESILEQIEKEKSTLSENLEGPLTNVDQKTILQIRDFTKETSEDFQQRFIELYSDMRKNNRPVVDSIVDYIKSKSFHMPRFELANKNYARNLLRQCGYGDYKLEENSFLLVFNLPKPLAQYWWKGGANSWGEQAVDVGGQAIEWGYLYRELMPVVWERQGYFEDEKNLSFQRVNPIGDHDPKLFYYIWEVSGQN